MITAAVTGASHAAPSRRRPRDASRASKEIAFEDAIEASPARRRRLAPRRPARTRPRARARSCELFAFVEDTQADAWRELSARHGGEEVDAHERSSTALAKEIDERGTIDVLRHGVKDLGVEIRLAYFQPAHGLTPDSSTRYEANRLTVDAAVPVRQAIGQDARPRALRQRDPGRDRRAEEPAHRPGRRARDHAVPARPRPGERLALASGRSSTSRSTRTSCAMTTRLEGAATQFLPVQPGHARTAAPATRRTRRGHKTAYLWEEVWQRDNWLDLLGASSTSRSRRRLGGKSGTPRRRSSSRASTSGTRCGSSRRTRARTAPGQNYLVAALGRVREVEHDRLARAPARDPARRRRPQGLRQGRDHHRPARARPAASGAPSTSSSTSTASSQRIDKDSAQLAEALAGEQAQIIITTLQKFPFVLEQGRGAAARSRYAVIVDEAHSSQTGEAART